MLWQQAIRNLVLTLWHFWEFQVTFYIRTNNKTRWNISQLAMDKIRNYGIIPNDDSWNMLKQSNQQVIWGYIDKNMDKSVRMMYNKKMIH